MRYVRLMFLLAVLFVGCSKESHTDNVVFQAAVNSVSAFSVEVTVTHNATNRDIYYVFTVEGTVSDLDQEIAEFISESAPEHLESYAHSQRKSVFAISGLSPKSTFTLIVFGMNNDGNLYGKPFSVVFTTPGADIVAKKNPNWDICYAGYEVYKNTDYSKITVDVFGEVEERFFIMVFPVSFVNTFEDTEALIFYAVKEFLKSLEDQNDSDFWLDNRFVFKGDVSYYTYLKEGEYVAYAIGINADGTPTGHYAGTDCFYVDKYPATEGYASLLGFWTLTDSRDKEYLFLISEHVVNRSVEIVGWGNSPDYPVYAYFDRLDNSVRIPPQLVEEEVEITFSDDLTAKGELTLRGAYYDSEDKLRYLTSVSTLTVGTVYNGQYIFNCAFLDSLGSNMQEEQTGLSFYIERKDESNIGFARMMFPFVMTKCEE